MTVVLPLLLLLAGAAFGVVLCRRSVRAGATGGVVSLAGVVGKAVLARIPAAEARLFPFDAYPFVEPLWYLFPLGYTLGAGLWAARSSLWKRDLLLVLGGLFLARLGLLAWESRGGHADLRGRLGDDGICRQTTAWSCAPAAAVMFLDRHGIPADEREMAVLCASRPGLGGTSECGIARGLRRKMPGRRVEATAPGRLEDLPTPSLVSVRLNWLVNHCVMVEGLDAEGVKVADPIDGRRTVPRELFLREWTGSAIHVR